MLVLSLAAPALTNGDAYAYVGNALLVRQRTRRLRPLSPGSTASSTRCGTYR